MEWEATQQIAFESIEDDFESGEQLKIQVGTLKVLSYKNAPERSYPVYQGLNVIGRGPTCSIQIMISTLSKEHATIDATDEVHLLCDLSSANKTRRGKQILKPNVQYEIQDDTELTFGDVICKYVILANAVVREDGEMTNDESDLTLNSDLEISGLASDCILHSDSESDDSSDLAVNETPQSELPKPPSLNINTKDKGGIKLSFDSGSDTDIEDATTINIGATTSKENGVVYVFNYGINVALDANSDREDTSTLNAGANTSKENNVEKMVIESDSDTDTEVTNAYDVTSNAIKTCDGRNAALDSGSDTDIGESNSEDVNTIVKQKNDCKKMQECIRNADDSDLGNISDVETVPYPWGGQYNQLENNPIVDPNNTSDMEKSPIDPEIYIADTQPLTVPKYLSQAQNVEMDAETQFYPFVGDSNETAQRVEEEQPTKEISGITEENRTTGTDFNCSSTEDNNDRLNNNDVINIAPVSKGTSNSVVKAQVTPDTNCNVSSITSTKSSKKSPKKNTCKETPTTNRSAVRCTTRNKRKSTPHKLIVTEDKSPVRKSVARRKMTFSSSSEDEVCSSSKRIKNVDSTTPVRRSVRDVKKPVKFQDTSPVKTEKLKCVIKTTRTVKMVHETSDSSSPTTSLEISETPRPKRGGRTRKTQVVPETPKSLSPSTSVEISETPQSKRGVRTRKAQVKVSRQSIEQKQTPTSKSLKVTFTGMINTKTLEKIVVNLGGELTESVTECTHLVTDKVRRTCKLLCAMSRGCNIVLPQWINASKTANEFVGEIDYLVRDTEAEGKFDFVMEDSLSRAAAKIRFLSEYSIHVTKNVKPPPPEMKSIIECAGGKVIGRMPTKKGRIGVTLIISCLQDLKSCTKSRKADIPIVTSEFILTGVLRQKAQSNLYLI